MKRVITFLLLIIMLSTAVCAVGIDDIAGHWAEEDISALVEKGIINGMSDTEYAPNQNMTRAQFVATMNRAFSDAVQTSRAVFADVSESDWFYDDVTKGLVNGMGNEIFEPYLPISRQDACVLVVRYMGDETITSTPNISDYSAIADYAKEAVATMIERGIVGGYPDGTFNPLGNITRAEVASIVNRALGANETEIPSPDLWEFTPSEGKVVYDFTGLSFFEKVDGSDVLKHMTQELQIELGARQLKYPEHSTTAKAMQSLISGEKDIIFVTCPSPKDFELAKAAGVELEGAAIARDGLVFLTHRKNPLNYISQTQIKDIYSEKIKTLGDMGISAPEKQGEIIAYADEDARGDILRFMDGVTFTKEEKPRFSKVFYSAGGGGSSTPLPQSNKYDEISNDLDGIGYSYYFLEENADWIQNSKYLIVDDVVPTKKAIIEGEYPIMVEYYAIIRKDSPEGSFERELLKYVLSIEGQRVIREAGYVGI